jgi:hypothetical protein
MKDINPRAEQFPECRQAVRELCAQFSNHKTNEGFVR